jgi:hypothetical protein
LVCGYSRLRTQSGGFIMGSQTAGREQGSRQ